MTARKNSDHDPKNGSSSPEAKSPEAVTSTTSIHPKKRVRPAKSAGAKVAAGKKKTARPAAKKATARRRSSIPTTAGPSDADIRLRAYFIAERRVQLALQGDPSRDWLEAKRQLSEEATSQLQA